jgi:TrpR-related protein YerC/YecD
MRRVKRAASDAGAAAHEKDLEALCEAFLQLGTAEECERFLRDLCTPAEISALVERWKIARILHEDRMSYRQIHDYARRAVPAGGTVPRLSHRPGQAWGKEETESGQDMSPEADTHAIRAKACSRSACPEKKPPPPHALARVRHLPHFALQNGGGNGKPHDFPPPSREAR